MSASIKPKSRIGNTMSGIDSSTKLIEIEREYGANNYDPLPVVVSHGEGAWLWDVDGRRFLDMMRAYSAVSHGHAHPRIVATLVAQAQRLASRRARFTTTSCRCCSSA